MSQVGLKEYGKGAEAQREKRILDNLPLVKQIAHAFSRRTPRHVEASDLISAGTLGLIKAVDQFEPERKVVFKAFALKYIRGAILDHMRAQDPIPTSTRSKIRRIENATLRLQKELHRLPTEDEIAADLKMKPEDVTSLMREATALPLFSADEVGEKEDVDLLRIVNHEHDALAAIEHAQLKKIVTEIVVSLPQTERTIITLYYFEALRMKEIGTVLGISESRVSQLHSRGMMLLRARMREQLQRRE